MLFHYYYYAWFCSAGKKTWWLDFQAEAAAAFVLAGYQNCPINNPVSVYTEDKIRKCKIYIRYRRLPDYYAVQAQSGLRGFILC